MSARPRGRPGDREGVEHRQRREPRLPRQHESHRTNRVRRLRAETLRLVRRTERAGRIGRRPRHGGSGADAARCRHDCTSRRDVHQHRCYVDEPGGDHRILGDNRVGVQQGVGLDRLLDRRALGHTRRGIAGVHVVLRLACLVGWVAGGHRARGQHHEAQRRPASRSHAVCIGRSGQSVNGFRVIRTRWTWTRYSVGSLA